MKREFAVDRLIENSDKCVNMLELCHKMGIEHVGGEDYKEIRQLAKELGIELKFSYKRNEEIKTYPRKKIEEILIKDSKYKNATRIKERLIKEGLKENKCEKCGLTSWLGEDISLQIHHINGKHDDNRLENIQILCPNCHSQTDTYSGRNANRENATKYLKKYKENINNKKSFEETHPTKKELISSFSELKSFVEVGKKYGVTDSAIRKWFKHYGIPTKKKEILDYLNKLTSYK